MENNFQDVMSMPRDVLTKRMIECASNLLTTEQISAFKQSLNNKSDAEFFSLIFKSLCEASKHPTDQKEFSRLSTELIQKFSTTYENMETQNGQIEIMDPEANKCLWNDINSSKPSDVVYLTQKEDDLIKSFWNHEVKENKFNFVPSDIIFANTIPIMDLNFVVDCSETGGDIIKFRIVIFPDYQKRICDSTEEKSVIIGSLITDQNKKLLCFPISVCKGFNKILSNGNIGFRNVSKEEIYGLKKQLPISHAIILYFDCLSTWYGIQIALLHPTVKEIFKNPKSEPVEVIIKKKNKKPRKRIVRYMKKHVIKVDDIEEALYGGKDKKFERHTLVWYVIGHWRNYKNGKKIFIQPYWKGALREMKMNLDEREREIILPESEVVTEPN